MNKNLGEIFFPQILIYVENAYASYGRLQNLDPEKQTFLCIYIYIAKRFSNPRKESTPCDGDGKRK